MPSNADQQSIANWSKELSERAERYRTLARRMAEQTVTESSVDKSVQVTVSSRGTLVDLNLAEAAAAKGMPALAKQIMATVKRAQARIPELLEQAMAESVGRSDDAASTLVTQVRELFPAVTDEPVPELWRELKLDTDDGVHQRTQPTHQTQATRQPQPTERRRLVRPPDEDDEFRGFGEL